MIIENKLNVGDRVQSTIKGYYYGVPGTVKELEKGYEGTFDNVVKKYVIELDNGEEITLATNAMERVEEGDEE